MTRASRAAVLIASLLAPSACTGFSSVRSAEVTPGGTIDYGLTLTTPPGDAAAWFWAFDCASACDHAFPAVDVSYTHGRVPEAPERPYEIGAGISGFYPYAHGYVQVGRGSRPWGVGGRFALSLGGWYEASLQVRKDLPLGRRTRLLVVPTAFAHWGNSPNAANPGIFYALAQGLGLEHTTGRLSVTPTALLVLGRVNRRSYGERIRDGTTFAVLGLTVRPR